MAGWPEPGPSLRWSTGQVFRRHGWKGLAAVFVAVPLGLTATFFPNSLAGRYIERWMERQKLKIERERGRSL
jgi:uncharacterized membrane protein